MTTKRWLTTAEVAKLLRITPTAVRAAARDGRLRAAMTVANIRLFELEDVEQFAQRREHRTRKPRK